MSESPKTGPAPASATGDLVIEAAMRDLLSVPPDDLDGVLAASESAHRALQARLSDLGD